MPAVPVVSCHFRGALSLSLSVFTLDRVSQLWVLFLLLIPPCHLLAVAAGEQGWGKAGILSLLGLDLPFHLTLVLQGQKKKEI